MQIYDEYEERHKNRLKEEYSKCARDREGEPKE